MDLEKMKDVITKIEAHKKVIAKERDAIRVLYYEIGDLLDVFDVGVQGLDDGIYAITKAIDRVSDVV